MQIQEWYALGAERHTDALPPGDKIYNSADDQFYSGVMQVMMESMAQRMISMPPQWIQTLRNGGQIDADADNNKDLLDESLDLQHFGVAGFVDYIQTLANVRAVNGGTMSRLGYAEHP